MDEIRQIEKEVSPGWKDFYDKALAWNINSSEKDTEALIQSAVKYFHPAIPDKGYKPSFLSIDEASKLVLDGIVLGDMAGCPYEGMSVEVRTGYYTPADYKKMPFLLDNSSHFTDDSVMSVAIYKGAHIIRNLREPMSLNNGNDIRIYSESMKQLAKRFPSAGYGSWFCEWALCRGDTDESYKSFGNGSAMRSGVIGAMFADRTVDDVIRQSALSALPTHSHPEGIKAAVTTSVAVYLGLHGISKDKIVDYMTKLYLDNDYDRRAVRPDTDMEQLTRHMVYTISVKSQVTMPEVIINLRNSDSYESCIRNVFRYSCDADTVGAISGGIAAAIYKNTDVDGLDAEKKADDELMQIFKQTDGILFPSW